MTQTNPTVAKDAAKIAGLLRQHRTTIRALMAKYHCGYPTMIGAVLSQMSEAEWKQIKRGRLLAANLATRFKRGHNTWNKGVKGIHLSPATEFKKGCLRGQAARRWRPIGTITIRYDNPLRSQSRRRGPKVKGKARRWIKVRDDGPPHRRCIPYARYLWEQRNGPVPAGFFVIHKDGNQMHDAIANLTIVDRRRNMQRSCHSNPDVVARRHIAATKSRKANAEFRRNARRLHGPQRPAWYCPACGATYNHHPDRCNKCSSAAFERIKIPG